MHNNGVLKLAQQNEMMPLVMLLAIPLFGKSTVLCEKGILMWKDNTHFSNNFLYVLII